MKKIIFTGGPCVGKTTTLNLLKSSLDGVHVIDEVPRDVIESEQKLKSANSSHDTVLPWIDGKFDDFQKLVIAEQILREKNAPEDSKMVLLDRSLVDVLGYCKVFGKSAPAELLSHIKNAGYEKIFFLERLNSYVNDAERKEDTVFAGKIHNAILEAYRELGFPVIIVPSFDGKAKERADFIRAHL